MGDHMAKHGDGVKDVAFEVEDLDAIYQVSSVGKLKYLPDCHTYHVSCCVSAIFNGDFPSGNDKGM